MTYDRGTIPRFIVHESVLRPDGTEAVAYYTKRKMRGVKENNIGHKCILGMVTTQTGETLERTDDIAEAEQWLKDEAEEVRLFETAMVLSEGHVDGNIVTMEGPE